MADTGEEFRGTRQIAPNVYAPPSTPKNRSNPVGGTPMAADGVGYGHAKSQCDGDLRLSGNKNAHRIGKRSK